MLYNAAQGWQWRNSSGWFVDNSTLDACAQGWYGISCSPSNTLIRLDLSANALDTHGAIYPRLPMLMQAMPQLEMLSLHNNPRFIATATVVQCMGTLPAMSSIDLANNTNMRLPLQFFTMFPMLRILNISNIVLSSQLPLLAALSMLHTLRADNAILLDVQSFNEYSAPANISVLSMRGCNLQADASALFSYTQLTVLAFDDNQLTNNNALTFPAQPMNKLTFLSLSNNLLTGMASMHA